MAPPCRLCDLEPEAFDTPTIFTHSSCRPSRDEPPLHAPAAIAAFPRDEPSVASPHRYHPLARGATPRAARRRRECGSVLRASPPSPLPEPCRILDIEAPDTGFGGPFWGEVQTLSHKGPAGGGRGSLDARCAISKRASRFLVLAARSCRAPPCPLVDYGGTVSVAGMNRLAERRPSLPTSHAAVWIPPMLVNKGNLGRRGA